MADIDFGFEPNNGVNNTSGTTANSEGITSLDEGKQVTQGANGENISDITDNDNGESNEGASQNKPNENPDKQDDNLAEGTEIEYENAVYTIDANGNLIDKEGNVFKEAKDVKAWMDSLEQVEDEDDEIDVKALQDIIGIQLNDENGKALTFDNSTEGFKSYINALLSNVADEQAEIAMNTIMTRFPFMSDMINYYIANGNSLNGYWNLQDRSNIVVNDNNEVQQENIIRVAWEEQNRKGDVNAYIQYLKSSGTLLSVAKAELEGLQEKDLQEKEEKRKLAEQKENEQIQMLENYWKTVHEVVNEGKIAGYQIPENIIVNRGGMKYSATRDDFFNYLYKVDSKGVSAYQKDLEQTTPESRIEDEILRAYLMFVGGNYSNLIDMAINNKEVSKLRFKAKERSNASIRIRKPKEAPKGVNLDLGYN